MQDQITIAKKAAGEKAAEFIRPGMVVGLGTGSTAYWAIQKIGAMVQQGLDIKGIATSEASAQLAKELGIPLTSFAETQRLDMDIDGADEVSERLDVIKGGGGALLREKIVAFHSKQLIIIADEHKYVPTLGNFPLAVEVIPFGWEVTNSKLQTLGCVPTLRKKQQEIFITDNGNYIIDCAFGKIENPQQVHNALHNIPGIVETGLFVQMAHTVVLGYEDGSTKVLQR
ncbi:ribose-5-phosphate isomerase RpiA [Chitinophaga agrisoli]|uniref:Ribose-5-phosphate isomerase A n=1 Tax=Chitinophaga agrisoli TaxID=2607653 RepID=A0A5B2W2N6_9BACT|nr:ribose-5-phosphate isomerase RpiA [Chitinophaga agrisoli]KAA2245010.1 ribose-5-phosphate isomerase RpiA [Chitinophaga agrisoli]